MKRLLAIPNVSEGRGRTTDDAVRAINVEHGRVLDVHADPDHNRTVYTFTADDLIEPMLALAEVARDEIDLRTEPGLHPHVGALDVAPIVYLDDADRGAACATALVLADRLGCEGLPVFIYGELAGGRTRASLRRGGLDELARRVEGGELNPDFGPRELSESTGATLVGARPPLIAFNAELAPPAGADEARAIAAELRTTLPGVRAIGLWLEQGGGAQVSMNIEDYARCSPAQAVAAIERHARVEECELVGLAPRAAFADFRQAEIQVRNLRLLEDVL